MNELIKRVAERTGIGEDKAKSAVDTVLGFLKEKLPAPIASQIDNAVGGEGGGGIADKAGDMLGSVKGMFGK